MTADLGMALLLGKSALLSLPEWAMIVPVKALPAFLAMAVTALAAPSDPGETAVHFLEKVRAKNLNLEPGGDTALSPQTSTQKRREIARRLDRMARDLGSDPLEVGAVKLDDDLAAVLVRQIGGFDPSRLQVFPVALVKRGAEWAAAPVPASFENSGVGYAAILRQRLALLEDWMLREQALDLEKLREQSTERMRRNIEKTLPAATLRTFTSSQAAERFLTACAQRNLPEMFGLLGGLAATLPNDWPLRLKAADAAVAAAAEVKHPWRLLLAPEVLRARVDFDEDGDTALVSIACLDPAGSPARAALPRIELVHLELSKTPDGLWRIDLPGNFLEDSGISDDPTDEDLDTDLLNQFPAKLAALYPPSPHPTAEQARQALLTSLQEGDPTHLIRLIRLDGDPKAARKSCVRAAHIWWALREPATVRCAVPLASHEAGEHAAAAFQFFSARNPDRLSLQILYFGKSSNGWYWTPEPRPETTKSFREWTDLQAQRWQDEWQPAFLSDCLVLDRFPAAGAPAADESRKLIESWLRAIRAGDVMAALRLTARLDTPDSNATLLRNLGYEITGARHNRHLPSVSGIHRGDIWSAVGTQNAPADPPACPLYPVIATPAGPRILLEIDLFASASRSRAFLNKTSFERLRKSNLPAADELMKLFSEHQTQVANPANP